MLLSPFIALPPAAVTDESMRNYELFSGPSGLAAIKSLREEGFLVTAFERRSEPGGVWSFTDDANITSVTCYTSTQLSKFIVSGFALSRSWGAWAVLN